MADQGSQEKTEQATPKKLRDARKKGQVPKSRDVSQVFVLVVVLSVFAFSMSFMAGEFKNYFHACFDALQKRDISGGVIWDLGVAGLITFGKVLAPIFLAGMATGYFSGVIQVGAMFTVEPLKPQPNKLNPIEGVKNMFKIVTFIELIKNMIKISIVLYIAYSTISKSIDAVLSTSTIDILSSAKITGGILFEFLVKVCVCFIFVSLLDYAIQRWNFMKNLRMTKDEVKREYKQDEGDPAIKGERRRLHREMAFGDAKQAVKKSSAVVTNPIHVACAIEYNKDEMSAPILALKGQRDFAKMMVDIANEEGVPVVRNIPLAWSLLHLEEGDEIPEELYEAAAEVLAIVYEMKQAGADSDELITTPENPEPFM